MTANVALTDSFDQWRVKTNEVVVMTQTDGMSNFLKILDTTNSTSNTTGSIITAGGIGILKSAVIGENLRVHGNVITDGDTTISGNLTFGDADTDQVTFSADINSSIIPNANLTFNLGNTTQQWANTWTGHLGITQHTTSGIPALSVTSTDVDVIAITVLASQTTADVLDIVADSVSDAKVIDITADALTTGSALYIDSDSGSTGIRSIAKIIQNHASAVNSTALTVQADAGKGIFIDTDLAAGGPALEIDAEQATTTAVDINVDEATSATAISISADGLVTGTAFAIDSDSNSTGIRNIASIIQNHADASSSTTLYLRNDHATADALKVVGAVTVGVDNTGHDVKFFGATSEAFMEWDESADELEIRGPVATPGKLLLSTAEDTVVDGNKLGQIDFQAPRETGTDAIKVSASIWAEADATFSATVNDTDLVFATGLSEVATEKVRITSGGLVGIGIAAPTLILDVQHATAALANFKTTGSNSDAIVRVANDARSYDFRVLGSSADEFVIRDSVAGANRLTILADGNVGINQAAPGSKLHVTGTVQVGVNGTGHNVVFYGDTPGSNLTWNQSDDSLRLTDASRLRIGDGQDLELYHNGTHSYIDNKTGGLYIATQTSGIAVSIGHTTSEVTVNDNLTVTGDLTINGTTSTINSTTLTVDDKNIELGSVASPSDSTANLGGFTLKGASDKTILWTNSTDAWHFNQGINVTSGKVGIGISSAPTSPLQVEGPDPGSTGLIYAKLSSNSNNPMMVLKNENTGGNGTDNNGLWIDNRGGSGLSYSIRVVNSSAERFCVRADGKVGIGIAAPASLLDVRGTVQVGANDYGQDVYFFGDTAEKYLHWQSSGDQLQLRDSTNLAFGAGSDMTLYHNGTHSFINNGTGNLIINTTSGELDIGNQTSGIAVNIGHSTSLVSIGDNLTVTGTLTESSFRDLKTNIEPIENILPAVLQMQGVTFDWKKDEDKGLNHYGFIAEDVDKILPNLVSHDEQGKAQGIQYSKMTAVLLEAIKEQQIQIDELKAKLN